MAFTPVALIAGVTVTGRYQDFGVAPITSSDGSALVPGVDFTIDGAGKITLIKTVLAGSVCFTFHDGSGVIAGTPEYPAINGRLTADISGTSTPSNGLNVGERLNTLITHYQATNVVTYTEGVYSGTNFDLVAYCDGSLNNNPTGVVLLFELDLTIAPAVIWTDFENSEELS